MIKILLADDHQLVIDGMKLMIDDAPDMECIGYGNNGEEVLQLLEEKEADVLLLDVNMQKMNGIDTCRAVHIKYPKVKVIGLSMLKEASIIKLLLKFGAMGYIIKDAGHDEITTAIRQVYEGKKYFSPEVTDLVMASLSAESPKQKQTLLPELTRREKDVLKLIVNEFTTQEIADQLSIKFGTVETHRRNLLTKLGARNTAGLVRVCLEYKLLD